jgi:hypothetical protein
MSRGAGTGILAFGLVLGVVGAILRYAVTVNTSGFNINTAGVILLVVGVIAFLVGLLVVAMGGRSSSTLRDRTIETPQGHERIQEEDSRMS